jgi:hypothetical protein
MPRFNRVSLILLCLAAASCSRSEPDPVGRSRQSPAVAAAIVGASVADRAAPRGDHPLVPVLKLVEKSEANIEKNIHDYSANFSSGEHKSQFIKIRHVPFSVYFCTSEPESSKGQEGIYVEGQNDGKLLVHVPGITGRMLGTVALDPNGSIAMKGHRYPITAIGILNLCRQMRDSIKQDMDHEECEVKIVRDAEFAGRGCTRIEVTHPVPREHFVFHIARLYLDNQLDVPVRYEAFDWPKEPGAEPELIEGYSYRDLKPNNGFTDADFDTRNENYSFP